MKILLIILFAVTATIAQSRFERVLNYTPERDSLLKLSQVDSIFIVINQGQYNKFARKFGDQHALEPRPIKANKYILPLEVLADDTFAEVWEELKGLQIRRVRANEFLDEQ